MAAVYNTGDEWRANCWIPADQDSINSSARFWGDARQKKSTPERAFQPNLKPRYALRAMLSTRGTGAGESLKSRASSKVDSWRKTNASRFLRNSTRMRFLCFSTSLGFQGFSRLSENT